MLSQLDDQINSKQTQLSNADTRIRELNNDKAELLKGQKIGGASQNRLEEIRLEAQTKIVGYQRRIQESEDQISKIVEQQAGVTAAQTETLRAKIRTLESQIEEEAKSSRETVAAKKEIYLNRKEEIESKKQDRSLSIESDKDQIPIIKQEIIKIQESIDENKKIKRDASYNSQVYRLASLIYGKTDVADVTREEVKWVSIVWFGSIALIVSTIGTILALISYILRDPEAFVERKKFNLTRRINRLFYLIFWRFNRILLSATNLILAVAKLFLSFAEIFRGLIGQPVQRAIRLALIAYRRQLNKPR